METQLLCCSAGLSAQKPFGVKKKAGRLKPARFLIQGLTERRGVHQATISIECIQTTRQVERRIRAEVTVVDFTVVTDLLNNLIAEIGFQTEGQTEIALIA